jgi:hypothetical protein
LFVTHQLVRPAIDCWDAYVEAHEVAETFNWQETRNNFRTHHVPLGVMKLKKKEFEDLMEGSMTLSEFVTCFTQLSRYAPNVMDTDEKKQDWFLNGLNDGLAYALEACNFKKNQDMVDKAFVLKIEEQLWSARGRCSTLEPKEATRSFMMVLLKDRSFILASSKGYKLQHSVTPTFPNNKIWSN